jgi:hypothetical protein
LVANGMFQAWWFMEGQGKIYSFNYFVFPPKENDFIFPIHHQI